MRFQRIPEDVPGSHEELHVVLDWFGFEPTLEQVTGNIIFPVEFLRVYTVKPGHASGKDAFRDLNKEM